MIYALIGLYAWGAITCLYLLGTTVADRFVQHVNVWKMAALAAAWPAILPIIAMRWRNG